MKEKLSNVFMWVWLFVYFMIFQPIAFVLQGLITPIEIVLMCVREKRIIRPTEYWVEFGDHISDVYITWLYLDDYYEESEDEAE